MPKTAVTVIFGGASGEHEVSLASARSVIAALDPGSYDVTPVLVGKDGRWRIEPSALPEARRGAVSAGERVLAPAGPKGRLTDASGSPAERVDVVLPLIHGTTGEDGALQGLLELAGVPYVGSGVLGSAVGMDKAVQKKILARDGFPVVPFLDFRASEWGRRPEDLIADIERHLGYPNFVKPANLGSSVGISKAHHRAELLTGVEDALRYDTKIIVERAVSEAREIECAVIGNDEPETSVLGEIVPSNEFYDYEAKYLSGASRTIVPADLPATLASRIRTMAGGVFRCLEAAGMARVDFLVSRPTGDVYVNEINTIPGFTSISMFPKLWEATGLPYPALLDRLIALAVERDAAKKALTRSYAAKTEGAPV